MLNPRHGKDIRLPDVLDLTRLDFYAPWVRRLEDLNKQNIHTLLNFGALNILASRRPILPGLQSLAVIKDCKFFTELFLCPTLIEIRHVPLTDSRPYMGPRTTNEVLRKIRNVCPGLHKLELYPVAWEHGGHYSTLVYFPPDLAFQETLTSFSNLHSLTITPIVFHPGALQALGNLPLLESLAIIADWGDLPILDESLTVPNSYFCSLRHLELRHLYPEDLIILWNQPSLVQKLFSAIIECNPSMADEPYEEGQDWIDAFLANIPRASPLIAELELYFHDPPPEVGPYSVLGAREALLQLPLRRICMNGKRLPW